MKSRTRSVIAKAGICTAILAAAGINAPASGAARTPSLVDVKAVKGLRSAALDQALRAFEKHSSQVRNVRYLTLIDLRAHSSKRRMFIFDLVQGGHEQLLVAHGKGSDPDHDGFADRFSNRVGSLMSSHGAYVTRRTYHGRHGLSLRMEGLDPSNDRAMERAIVMHGADYVRPSRAHIGRSWGCPAIDRRHVKRLLPRLAGGSFVYIAK